MKRVAEKTKALPIASGMDLHARRLFAMSLRRTNDALSFGADRLVRWLNGWETLEERIRSWEPTPRDYKLYLAKYGGDAKKRMPLNDWSEESQKRILEIFDKMTTQVSVLYEGAKGDPEILSILRDPEKIYELVDINRLLEKYAVVPKVLLKPATGMYAIGYRTKDAHYASFSPAHDFEYFEQFEQDFPPEEELEQTEEMKANMARHIASRAHIPPYYEVQAAHAILDLARFGVLDRIRTCHCGTWFYAARSNRVHCGESCKHKRYANSDQFRKHRREYARKLYKLKKNGVGASSPREALKAARVLGKGARRTSSR